MQCLAHNFKSLRFYAVKTHGTHTVYFHLYSAYAACAAMLNRESKKCRVN